MNALSHRHAYCSTVTLLALRAPTTRPRVTANHSAASGSVVNVAEYILPSTIGRAR
jgi:hypothetical protein